MAFSRRSFSDNRRGYRGGRSNLRRTDPALPVPASSQHKLADIVSTDFEDDDNSPGGFPAVRNVELLATFNWVDRSAPTILVPGKPPRWTPPSPTQKLGEDSGVYYRDANGARYPSHPTEPAVRAILHQISEPDTANIDIFACGSTFGSLLHFAQGEPRTFRFGVERIGSTLFLVRKTNTPREVIEEVRGYGHTFPDAYTTWERDVKNSASHQRIIRYDFDNFKCVIRSESDGYLPSHVLAPDVEAGTSQTQDSTQDTEDGGAPLDQAWMSLALGSNPVSTKGPLSVETAGCSIPQCAIFDLKTRSIKVKEQSGVLVEEFYPRLWANQTPNFIIAYHQWGSFDSRNIHIVDVRDGIRDWETKNVKSLRRLSQLLEKLINFTCKPNGQLKFEVRRVESGPLEIWSEVSAWSALPQDLKIRWAGGDLEEVAERESKAEESRRQHQDVNEDEDDDADLLKF